MNEQVLFGTRARRGLALLLALGLVGATLSCAGSNGPSTLANESTCSSNADCAAGFVCDLQEHGRRACGPCKGAYADSVSDGIPRATACVDGYETACADLPAATTCGCGCGAGAFCSVSADHTSGACTPLLAPGAKCEGSWTCSSNLCFSCLGGNCTEALSGTCAMPLGDACTASSVECPWCMVGNGQSAGWCSEPCGAVALGSGLQSSSCTVGACLGASSTQAWGDCYVPCEWIDGVLMAHRTAGCPPGTMCKSYARAPDSVGSGYACQ